MNTSDSRSLSVYETASDPTTLSVARLQNRLLALRSKLASISAFAVDAETRAVIVETIDALDDELVMSERAAQWTATTADSGEDLAAYWTAKFAGATC